MMTIEQMPAIIESRIDHIARYKSYSIDEDAQELVWVTQETYTQADKAYAAQAIAETLEEFGFDDWTVMLTVRDDYKGYNDTEWTYA